MDGLRTMCDKAVAEDPIMLRTKLLSKPLLKINKVGFQSHSQRLRKNQWLLIRHDVTKALSKLPLAVIAKPPQKSKSKHSKHKEKLSGINNQANESKSKKLIPNC